MKKAISAALIGSALAAGGCFGGVLDHEAGPMTSKTSSETGFTKIELNGSADLVIEVGPEESIKIEGNQSRVDNVKTYVKDGVLVIDEKSEGLFGHSSGKLVVTITAPKIDAISLYGSGDIDATGLTGESFDLEIYGSGDVTATGEVDTASFVVKGSGDIQAKDLVAKSTSVDISGSGDVEVYAKKAISASVSGSGEVTYFGGAEDVIKSISGSGEVNAAK